MEAASAGRDGRGVVIGSLGVGSLVAAASLAGQDRSADRAAHVRRAPAHGLGAAVDRRCDRRTALDGTSILRRHGLSRVPRAPREQVVRFEWPCPGDLLQMDTKRFGRFTRPGHRVTGVRDRTGADKRLKVGWEYCHSVIDDHTRIAYSELQDDERADTVV